MNTWQRLLSPQRIGSNQPETDNRAPFERDYSRVLFSNAFRRLHAKTQVFPLPDNDHVHNRLTHSLEVADVGRSLGRAVGSVLSQRHGIDENDVGQVVATACLAHDIGNPPFGHAGEDAIGHFFRSGPGATYATTLSNQQRGDLEHFEGNAQGLRVLSRLSMYQDDGGMRLTAASLATFGKYPRGSHQRKDPSRAVSGKKFGYYHADQETAAAIATATGQIKLEDGAWARHPLAFLMEAADDLCYHILDLEDGVTLGLIDHAIAAELLAPILDQTSHDLRQRPISALRARAISTLINQVSTAFLDAEAAITAGSHEHSLTDTIPASAALQAIYATNMANCYRAPVVLGLEQAGYSVIGGLLDALLASVFDQRNSHLRGLLGNDIEQRLDHADDYQRILLVTDFVSGMSDGYALKLYRQFTGIDLRSV
ncbi:MAG: dGTP triphosphohydrolase [Planctomycetota bacterium]